MEKICIVKLRKNLTRPAESGAGTACGSGEGEGGQVMNISSFTDERLARAEMAGVSKPQEAERPSPRTVSLPLTQEQARSFQSNRYVQEILGCMETMEGKGPEGEPVVLQLKIESLAPMRMLKSGEVMQMLKISKSFLDTLVRKGELKSYKIGKLRRYMLDDILSYLERAVI